MLAHLLLAVLLQAHASNAQLGYELTVPDGFVDFPDGRASSPDVVECWTEDEAVSTQGAMVLCIQRMHGVLGREKLSGADLPVGSQLTTLRWRDFDIAGIRSRAERDEGPLFVLAAQVPLKPEAVQLTYAGPADQEARIDSLMQVTLASFQGKSNWLTSAERSERIGKSVGIWISIAFAGGVVWYMRKRRATA